MMRRAYGDTSLAGRRHYGKKPRNTLGITLIELLMVVSIIGILVALFLPAVQVSREAARKLKCSNRVRQLALAMHSHHDVWQQYPAGVTSREADPLFSRLSWLARLLPYIEQQALWDVSRIDYQRQPDPFRPVPHSAVATPVAAFACPSEGRADRAQFARNQYVAALTDYVGVAGTHFRARDGMLFLDSNLRNADVADGTSNTVFFGERPPSPDQWFGWWYAGYGQDGSGVPDMILGVRELNIGYDRFASCPPGPYRFQDGDVSDYCSTMHFWSCHSGGAHFAFVDGAVRFLSYDADAVLPELASRR